MRLQISHFKKCSFLILTQNTHKPHTTNFLIVRLLLKEKSTFKSLSQLLIPIVVRKTFSFRKMAYKIYPTQRISSRFRTDPLGSFGQIPPPAGALFSATHDLFTPPKIR